MGRSQTVAEFPLAYALPNLPIAKLMELQKFIWLANQGRPNVGDRVPMSNRTVDGIPLASGIVLAWNVAGAQGAAPPGEEAVLQECWYRAARSRWRRGGGLVSRGWSRGRMD